MLPPRPNLQGHKKRKPTHLSPPVAVEYDESGNIVVEPEPAPGAAPKKKKPKPKAPGLVLSNLQKRFLRGLGHKIDPQVNLGKEGVSPTAAKNLEAQLLRHELVKVKLNSNVADQEDALLEETLEATGAILVFRIGHMALIYRPHPTTPKLALPTSAKKSRRLLRAPRT